MPIISSDARTIALGCLVGTGRAAGAPDSYTVHLFDGDPEADGLELEDETESVPNGYAAGTVDSDDFTFDGEVATASAAMPAPLAEYAATATHFVMRSGGDDWFSAALLEPLDVVSAGAAYEVACSLFFDSAVEPPA